MNIDYKKYELRNVKRICKILECFLLNKRELSLSEICLYTGIQKSIIFRILVNLEEEGYISRNSQNNKLFLGIKIFQLGNVAKQEIKMLNKAYPVMDELSNKTKENVYLHKLFQNKRICISKIEAPQDIKLILEIGDSFPLYCEASGKVIMAFLEEKEINYLILNEKLISLGPRTIIVPDLLKKELKKIKNNGYSVSYEERIPHSFSIASPIFNYQSKVIGSISVSGPNMRFDKNKINQLIPLLKSASIKISCFLGCTSLTK